MSDHEFVGDTTGSPESSEMDTEPVLYLSELQSSCDTYMSQRSDIEGNNEDEQGQCNEIGENIEVAETDKTGVNSSLEVETNFSPNNVSVCLPERVDISEVKVSAGENSQGEIVEENAQTCEGSPKDLRKRKARTDNMPLTLKKFRKESPKRSVTPEKQHAIQVFPESPEQNQSVGVVVNISSTSEKTIDLEGSQEFSLRIEDTSPPSHPSDEKSQEGSLWKSHTAEKQVTPEQGGYSQKSLVSWASHDQSLSWSSHKDQDEKLQESKIENEEQLKDDSSQKNDSLSPLQEGKAKNIDSDSSSKCQHVMEERLLLSSILWTIEDNKVISGEIKQVSLLEEPSCNEKLGRMSIMSSSTCKTSSSSGSVGLPGPFPLPGCTRLSILSTISSSTSSSMERAYNRPGWDGPFLKPTVPDSTKPVLVCGHCHSAYPALEKASSPVVNGSPKLISKIEELVPEKSASRRRIRGKGSVPIHAQSSGTLEEETSSSSSQPQAASTPTPSKRRRPRKRTDILKKDPSTPIKTTKLGSPGRTPMPDRNLALPLTPTSTQSNHPSKGEAVLAKWAGDGRYYPGWAKLSNSSTQTSVHFCDGQRKVMSSTWVVRADIITAGTLLLVTVDSTSLEYEECLVVQVNMEGPEPVYQVERDNESRDVQFSNIALLEAQVLELTMAVVQKTPATLNFNDVSLENIVSHPRKRSARTPFGEAASPGLKKKKRQITPEPSTSNGQTFGGPENVYLDTDSSTHSSCSLDLRGREVKPLDVECSPPEVHEESRLKLSHYRRNKTSKSKGKIDEDEPEHLVELMGPIPEMGSDLFTDCVFLITYTTQVGLQVYYLTPDAGSSGFEDTSRNGSTIPLWKERLRTQIKNGGGKVYTTLSQVSKEELPNTYLMTDKPCNTPLYLQCLVSSVPIYSTSVIQKCCSQNRPFKELIGLRSTKKLPAGYSLSRQCLVNPRSSQPLRGKALLLALSGEPTLSTFWDNIIRKIGGTCEVFRGRCLIENRFDVIVTDSDCDQQLVSQACEQKVPLVSLVWLQQCIINGDFRSPTEHPLYKYNTSEGHDSPEY